MCINCGVPSCSACATSSPCTTCESAKVKELLIADADNVYYNPDNIYPSMLESIGVGNGYTIKYIVEKIVSRLNLSQGVGYSQYNLSCFEDCGIETAQDFAEVLSEEVCSLKQLITDLQTETAKLETIQKDIETLSYPKIKNGNTLGIKDKDAQEQILNILVDKYNSLPQFNPVYYKFDFINTSGNTQTVNYINHLNQIISVGVSPYNTIEVSNIKTILTSSNNTLTFIFKGV